MKVGIYAQSLVIACDKALEAMKPELAAENARRSEAYNRKARWWEAFSPVPQYTPPPFYGLKAAAITNLRSIAAYKRPDHLFEMTDQELADISQYLPPYADVDGRI